MGNCNCLSSTNNNKNAETSVEQPLNETKTNQQQNLQNNLHTTHEKRGVSIPTQSFVKQLSTIKNDNSRKNSAVFYDALSKNDPKFYLRFVNRTDINIVVMGDSNSGKSSFVIRYVTGKFEPYHVVSVCNEYYQKKGVNFNGKKYDLNFIVTAGKSEYKEDLKSTCQDADFFLMFYDVSSKKSFDNLKVAYNEINNFIFPYKDSYPNVMFIGNKHDLREKCVTIDDVKNILQNDKISVLEISVKNNTNITKVFNQIMEKFDSVTNSTFEK